MVSAVTVFKIELNSILPFTVFFLSFAMQLLFVCLLNCSTLIAFSL